MVPRRRRSSNEQRHDSTIEEAFADTNLPIPHGPAALWEPGGVPGQWSNVCGFILPPGSETEWHIRMHGAFKIPHETLGIKRTEQSSHHEVRIHLLLVNARLVDRASRDGHYRRPFVRKKDSPYDHKQQNHVATHARNPAIRVGKRDNSRIPPRCPRPPKWSARKFMSAAIRFNASDHQGAR